MDRVVPAAALGVLTWQLLKAVNAASVRKAPSRPVEPGMPAGQKGADKELWFLFADEWENRLFMQPEMATQLGDGRYNARLTDVSPSGFKERHHLDQEFLRRLRRIPRDQLSKENQLSYDIFERDLETAAAFFEFSPWHFQANQLFGLHLDFARLPSFHPLNTPKNLADYVCRLRAFPQQVDQLIAAFTSGVKASQTQPRLAVEAMIKQCEAQRDTPASKSPLYTALHSKWGVSHAECKAALAAVEDCVIPAYKKLTHFLESVYLPAARTEPGYSSLPRGREFYDHLVASFTTTSMTAKEVHELGLSEVKALRTQILRLMKDDWEGCAAGEEFAAIQSKVNEDKAANFYHNRDQPCAVYQEVLDRAAERLPEFFGILPKAPYEIRPVEAFAERAAPPAFYFKAPDDGSRAAYFYVNTYKPEQRPSYMSESIGLHEGLPGHHLQLAISAELEKVPRFRKHNDSFVAYIEGWGLYSEWLGLEMGFYKDRMQEFGRLNAEIWRACRLVVDTGVHALGWSRDQAVAYMEANTFLSPVEVGSEVDRYIVYPGQALTYKIGQLKIMDLNTHAKQELGNAFSYPDFHDALLCQGALPLTVLDEYIKGWVQLQKKKAEVAV